ncbi:metallophosphoesterase [Pandoraea sp. NPDC087047]|uniref:metallophosphoesterase n=1 Tax=Pandoraea sp. NPDC087047 TaxID=3364390 RepID=UPI0037F46C44
MTKIIHITDTHLVTPGELLYGLDPYQRLVACIDDILAHHTDAECCVITGDLTHRDQVTVHFHDYLDKSAMKDDDAPGCHRGVLDARGVAAPVCVS